MKHILIDLEKLKNRNVGLGEVAYRYAEALSQKASLIKALGLHIHLLVPPEFTGYWGDAFSYLKTGFFHRHFPSSLPEFDLWHSLHQTSGYVPPHHTKKVLLTIHDLNLLQEKKGWKAAKYKRLIQTNVNRATHISTISQFSAKEIMSHLDLQDKKLRIIHNGAENPLNGPAVKPDIPLPSAFLFHISSLTAKKNVHTLIEMMKQLPSQHLVVAGDWKNDYAIEMKKRIHALALSNITCIHLPTNEEKNWLYRNCTAFLFPSLFEGFGLPVIEAFYSGKPVFSSNRTSLREIGANMAVYWEHFDPAYMASVVQKNMPLITSNAMQKERITYASQFNWSNAADEYLRLYVEMLEEKG